MKTEGRSKQTASNAKLSNTVNSSPNLHDLFWYADKFERLCFFSIPEQIHASRKTD